MFSYLVSRRIRESTAVTRSWPGREMSTRPFCCCLLNWTLNEYVSLAWLQGSINQHSHSRNFNMWECFEISNQRSASVVVVKIRGWMGAVWSGLTTRVRSEIVAWCVHQLHKRLGSVCVQYNSMHLIPPSCTYTGWRSLALCLVERKHRNLKCQQGREIQTTPFCC